MKIYYYLGIFSTISLIFFLTIGSEINKPSRVSKGQIQSSIIEEAGQRESYSLGQSKEANNRPQKTRDKLNITKEVKQRSYERGDKTIKESLVVERDFIYPNLIIRETSDANTRNSVAVVADHFLVSFDNKSEKEVEAFAKENQLKIRRKMLLPSTYILAFEDFSFENRDRVKNKLRASSELNLSEEDQVVFASSKPNDINYDKQWGLHNNGQEYNAQENFHIQAQKAWDLRTDCSDIQIAVVDSGVDTQHPDLKDNILVGKGYNGLRGVERDFRDDNGHGTHVAGIIGASGNNNIGLSGVCWKAKIIPIKVFGPTGSGPLSSIIDGITYVHQFTTAKIINASLGVSGIDQGSMWKNAVRPFTEKGGVFVAAAGNQAENNDAISVFPASLELPGVISVASTSPLGSLSNFSNYGQTSVDIAAPGTRIFSTLPNGEYGFKSGTSMAAPHVSGAIALAWSLDPELKSSELISYLLESADVGPYDNKIASNRELNLESFLKAVPLSVGFEISSDEYIAEETYEFNLDLKGFLSQIEKVEVMIDGETIQAFVPTDTLIRAAITMPRSGAINIKVRIIRKDATIENTAAREIEISEKIERAIEFKELKIDEVDGGESCKIKLSGIGNGRDLYEGKFLSSIQCKRFCEVYGPLARSDKDIVECGNSEQVFYKSQELGM